MNKTTHQALKLLLYMLASTTIFLSVLYFSLCYLMPPPPEDKTPLPPKKIRMILQGSYDKVHYETIDTVYY